MLFLVTLKLLLKLIKIPRYLQNRSDLFRICIRRCWLRRIRVLIYSIVRLGTDAAIFQNG